jgi:hypothetical protein
VSDVLVGKRVHGFFAVPGTCHQARGSTDAKMLRRKRLRDSDPLDQFVHTAGLVRQLQDDRQTVRRAQSTKQLGAVRKAAVIHRFWGPRPVTG